MLSIRFPWSRGNRHCLLHRYIIEVPDYLSTDTWLLSLLCRFLAALQSHIGVCNLTHHHSYIRVYCVADIVTRPLFAIRIKANWEIFCLVISDKVSLENFPPVFMQTGLKGRWFDPLHKTHFALQLFWNYPVALDMSEDIQCGVATDLTGSCSALWSFHNKVRISLQVLLRSSIYKFNNI